MPRVRVDVRNKAGESIAIEIQPVEMGPVYTFCEGQEADISNPVEFARVCQMPGVTILDGSRQPAAPLTPERGPRRGPGRPRKN